MLHFPYLNVTFLNASTVLPHCTSGVPLTYHALLSTLSYKAIVRILSLHRELQIAGILLLLHHSVSYTRPIIIVP